ncbi:MAG: hypothetical protein R3B72_30920 [Polyangiaceae bacterium]
MRLRLLLGLSLLGISCASQPVVTPPVVPVAPPVIETPADPPEPAPATSGKDTLERVRQALGTKMGLLVDLEAIRQHPARDVLEEYLVPESPLLDPALVAGTKRLLLTATNGQFGARWAVVVEHDLSPGELDAVFAHLDRRCEPAAIEGVALALHCGRSRLFTVAAPTPKLVVYTRTEPELLRALVASPGLPKPVAAVEGWVDEPHRTFRGRNMPPIPETIARGRGRLELQEDGVELILEGDCESPSQAESDAAALNRVVETSLPVPDLLIKPLQRLLHFTPDEKIVRLRRAVGTNELRFFLSLTRQLSKRDTRELHRD